MEIVIVDNASADDSINQLSAAVPQAHIIANGVNSGFAGGCNIGIRRAVELGCEYIFLLNNDALAERETIARLISASKAKEDNALLGSAVVYVSSGAYQFFGSRMRRILCEPKFLTMEKDAEMLSQDFIESDFIAGMAFFIPARLLSQIGYLDERFFLNYEETDFCYRARKLGISCFVVPGSLVRHHANISMGSYPAPMQAYFLTRNGMLFAEMHGPASQMRPGFLIKRLYWDLRRAWKVAARKDLPTFAILRAYWDYFRRRFGDCPPIIRQMDTAYRHVTSDETKRRHAAVVP